MDVDSLLRELNDLEPTSSRRGGRAPPPEGNSWSPHMQPSPPPGARSPAPNLSPGTQQGAGRRQSEEFELPGPPPPGKYSRREPSDSTSSVTTTLGAGTHVHHARGYSAGQGLNVRPSLDELLDDLDSAGLGAGAGTTSSSTRTSLTGRISAGGDAPRGSVSKTSSMTAGSGPRQKCLSVWVSGASKERGRYGVQVGSIVCCDNVRCTKCDFKVSYFFNKAWDDGVDYLFFRNNFPTESKLAPMMLPKPGGTAYCCQCSWLSVVSDKKIDFGTDLRWVCGGHTS